VTLADAYLNISPGFISLAKIACRFLERRLLIEPVLLGTLLKHFARARRFKCIPSALGVEGHPDLCSDGGRRHTTSLLTALGHIIYRSDVRSGFCSLATPATLHKRVRARDDLADLKFAREAGCIDEAVVRRHAILYHFRETYNPDCMYSLPLSAGAAITSLGKLLDEPDAKRVCFGGVGRPEADDMVPDVDIDDPDQPDHSPSNFGDICFRVVLLRPGSKKTLPLKPGSGRKVRPDHVAITILAVVVAEGADDANRAVASTPLLPRGSCTVSPDPVALLTDLAADVNELEKGFKCWERQPMLMYTLADVSFTPPVREKQRHFAILCPCWLPAVHFQAAEVFFLIQKANHQYTLAFATCITKVL